jgi:hypothetical protein
MASSLKERMCDFKHKSHMIDGPDDAPVWIRCEKCGRRLKPRLKDCHWSGGVGACWHWSVPPHKVKGWWKLGKTKKTSRDRGREK